jgi:predicted RNase H-like HicB family nuclease
MTVIFEQCDEGGWYVYVEGAGVHSQGETLEEAMEMIAAAFKEILASKIDDLSAEARATARIEISISSA